MTRLLIRRKRENCYLLVSRIKRSSPPSTKTSILSLNTWRNLTPLSCSWWTKIPLAWIRNSTPKTTKSSKGKKWKCSYPNAPMMVFKDWKPFWKKIKMTISTQTQSKTWATKKYKFTSTWSSENPLNSEATFYSISKSPNHPSETSTWSNKTKSPNSTSILTSEPKTWNFSETTKFRKSSKD